jgi:VCBS repeat-containing protein
VAAPGVLSNDADADGDALTASVVSGPAHGTVTVNANGSLIYVPATNYNGFDSFTYKTNDGTSDSNIATVSISVAPVNDPPVAVNNSLSVNEDTILSVAAPGVLADDADVDGNTLTAILVSSPIHGSLTLNTNGSLTYTPAANYNGTDSFTYKARDGAVDSNVATVSITILPANDAPVATSKSTSVNEDANTAITLSGTDLDGNSLAFTIVTPPARGTLTGTLPNLTYRGVLNYNGPDSFTYRANDGTVDSTNIATVTITVNPVNDAPVAQNGSVTTRKKTTVSGQAIATDVDGNALTYRITTLPTRGTVTINPATGAFSYRPYNGSTGADSFQFRANDGTVDSGVGIITITIQS